MRSKRVPGGRRAVLLVLMFWFGMQLTLSGQDNALKPVSGQKAQGVYVDRRAVLIDSLNNYISQLSIRQDSLQRVLRKQGEAIDETSRKAAQVEEENRRLKSRLEEARGDNLQSSHTNSILFIFNVGVGIFLLIALIWMFMRRRNDEEGEEQPPHPTKRKINGEENFDFKLDRIQKLGSLREKGLLTDDEFNIQKKQILGE